MTPIEFHYAIEDWKALKELDRQFAYSTADVNVINAVKSASELIPLPWDEKTITKMPTKEEWAKWDVN